MLPGAEWRLFLALWIAYAGFHQGGGWNQNARFAQVRAIVLEGRLDVGGQLVYSGSRENAGETRLRRSPVERGVFRADGRAFALTWPGGAPLADDAPPDAEPVALERVAASGDLAYAGGRLYPNKAPGTTFLALPAYLAVSRLQRALGIDPDGWWALTWGAWLTTVLSLGMLSAAGGVLLRRAALRLWPGHPRAATAAALVFGLATPFWPYATLLFEQNAAAVALLAAAERVWAAREAPTLRAARPALLCAGLAAGAAVATSYLAALALPLLALPLRRAGRGGGAWLAVGLVPPLALLALYHQLCFGAPWTTAYAFQNPLFRGADAGLGVLGAPSPARLLAVLVSPYRGLFFHAPVLLVGAVGLLWMARQPARRADAGLCGGVFAVHLLFNSAFHGWHGGWGVGPRYLVPALPFLALPIALALQRIPRTTALLASVSAAAMLIFTAVDAQPPVGSSPIAERPDRERLLREPLSEYALPILWTGRAEPILAAQRESVGEAPPGALPLERFAGPVSANPIGVHQAWLWTPEFPSAGAAAWSSFNVGELLWPGRRLSLLFLLAPLALAASALANAGTEAR